MSAAFEIEAKMVAATLSEAALVSLDWMDLDPEECVADDLAEIRSGMSTATMLGECVAATDGEEEIAQGWREYVATLEAHLAKAAAK